MRPHNSTLNRVGPPVSIVFWLFTPVQGSKERAGNSSKKSYWWLRDHHHSRSRIPTDLGRRGPAKRVAIAGQSSTFSFYRTYIVHRFSGLVGSLFLQRRDKIKCDGQRPCSGRSLFSLMFSDKNLTLDNIDPNPIALQISWGFSLCQTGFGR